MYNLKYKCISDGKTKNSIWVQHMIECEHVSESTSDMEKNHNTLQLTPCVTNEEFFFFFLNKNFYVCLY